jgi:hypothetical protein
MDLGIARQDRKTPFSKLAFLLKLSIIMAGLAHVPTTEIDS